MGLRIQTNIASISAQRALGKVSASLSDSFRKLSSGLRIETAADDAAGLGISNHMRAEIRSWGAAKRNIDDGLSIARAAEAGLGDASGHLLRMRELLVQGASGTLDVGDLAVLDLEFQGIKEELDRLASDTSLNGIPILKGAPQRISIFGSIDGQNPLLVSFTGVSVNSLGLQGTGIGVAGAPADQFAVMDTAIQKISTGRARLGAEQSRMTSAYSTASMASESLSAAESRIRDVDVAKETAELTRAQILQQAAVAVLAQANSQPELAMGLLSIQ